MTEIRSYDNLDDMLADMGRAEQAAQQRTLPAQAAISHGDWFFNWTHLADDLPIFGRVYTLVEHLHSAYLFGHAIRTSVGDRLDSAGVTAFDTPASIELARQIALDEAAHLGVALDAEEIDEGDEELRHTGGQYERGYRFCRAYSTIVPEGELGSTHVSSMIPITDEWADQARDADWAIPGLNQLNWFRRIIVGGVNGGVSGATHTARTLAEQRG